METKDKNFRVPFVCPYCHNSLQNSGDKLSCSVCNKIYSIFNNIPDFRENDAYWCNISRKKMKKLNDIAQKSGDWFVAAKELVPEYIDHFASFERADCQFLWPCTEDAKILDAGSMWGAITIPAAQFHSEVYAVDKTFETLDFLRIRAKQMGFENIYPIASGLRKLPFPDNFFDLAILNGVLEWVAFAEEAVFENDWKKLGRGFKAKSKTEYMENPKIVQISVLQEMNRVLKPGGCVYLAIENRIGYIYLVGYPDEHANLPFIGLLPRLFANEIAKLVLNREYRTYTYTIPGYRALLKQGGFDYTYCYGVFTHYIRPSEIVPLELIEYLKAKIASSKSALNRFILSLFPKSIMKWFSPSVAIIGTKGTFKQDHKPRLIQLLKEAKLLNGISSIVQCDSRPGNNLTANYYIYEENSKKPKYFCKVCRNKKSTEILDNESKNFKIIGGRIKDTELDAIIPKLLYHGTLCGINFMVTEFACGKVYLPRPSLCKNFVRLRKINKRMQQAIELLVKLQKVTRIETVTVRPYLIETIENQRKSLAQSQPISSETYKAIDRLIEELKPHGDITLSKCAVHGDYDFSNLLFCDGKITLVDFEHFQEEGLPFFDLANIIFSTLLITYGNSKSDTVLSEIVEKYRLKNYIENWLKMYSELSTIPLDLLRLIGPIAALEQRTKSYPDYRDPNTYPMFRRPIFEDLLKWRPENA